VAENSFPLSSIGAVDLGHAISPRLASSTQEQHGPKGDEPSGNLQLPQTYQFLLCFKCCFSRIDQAKEERENLQCM
jgi:hypothetical protein